MKVCLLFVIALKVFQGNTRPTSWSSERYPVLLLLQEDTNNACRVKMIMHDDRRGTRKQPIQDMLQSSPRSSTNGLEDRRCTSHPPTEAVLDVLECAPSKSTCPPWEWQWRSDPTRMIKKTVRRMTELIVGCVATCKTIFCPLVLGHCTLRNDVKSD